MLLSFEQNGERGIRTLAPLLTTYSLSRGAPSASLGTSPNRPTILHFTNEALFIITHRSCFVKHFLTLFSCKKRREWDSNPRALADKRFSRPPRYDHFDISPNIYKYTHQPFLCQCLIILSPIMPCVNTIF